MDAKRKRELEEQYIRGYLEYPETPEEEEWAAQASLVTLAENPWDEEETPEAKE